MDSNRLSLGKSQTFFNFFIFIIQNNKFKKSSRFSRTIYLLSKVSLVHHSITYNFTMDSHQVFLGKSWTFFNFFIFIIQNNKFKKSSRFSRTTYLQSKVSLVQHSITYNFTMDSHKVFLGKSWTFFNFFIFIIQNNKFKKSSRFSRTTNLQSKVSLVQHSITYNFTMDSHKVFLGKSWTFFNFFIFIIQNNKFKKSSRFSRTTYLQSKVSLVQHSITYNFTMDSHTGYFQENLQTFFNFFIFIIQNNKFKKSSRFSRTTYLQSKVSLVQHSITYNFTMDSHKVFLGKSWTFFNFFIFIIQNNKFKKSSRFSRTTYLQSKVSLVQHSITYNFTMDSHKVFLGKSWTFFNFFIFIIQNNKFKKSSRFSRTIYLQSKVSLVQHSITYNFTMDSHTGMSLGKSQTFFNFFIFIIQNNKFKKSSRFSRTTYLQSKVSLVQHSITYNFTMDNHKVFLGKSWTFFNFFIFIIQNNKFKKSSRFSRTTYLKSKVSLVQHSIIYNFTMDSNRLSLGKSWTFFNFFIFIIQNNKFKKS